MRLGASGEPPGEEKAPTYRCSHSLGLIINLLSHKKGANYINVIKVNGIRIPFSPSLSSCLGHKKDYLSSASASVMSL